MLVLVHDGFEEIELITPVDLCRRVGLEVCVCSMTGSLTLHGAHNIDLQADVLFEDAIPGIYDLIFLPGGMPNATSLRDDERVVSAVSKA